MSKLDVSHLENKAKTLGLSQMCVFLNLSSWKLRVRGPESKSPHPHGEKQTEAYAVKLHETVSFLLF